MKITFDPTGPGMAFVAQPGRKRPRKVMGRWIVFREKRTTAGIFPEDILFHSDRVDHCYAFIREAREREGFEASNR